MTPKQLL